MWASAHDSNVGETVAIAAGGTVEAGAVDATAVVTGRVERDLDLRL